MVISGIIIWWPSKNVTNKRNRQNVRSGTASRILNYDLHVVLGSFACWVLIFVVITGLFWGFAPVKSAVRNLSGEDRINYDIPRSTKAGNESLSNQFEIMELLAINMQHEFPDKNIRFSVPHKSLDPIQVSVIGKNHLVHNVDHMYFDRYTGEKLKGYFRPGLHQDAMYVYQSKWACL